MKVLILIASPRKNGNTFAMAEVISNKLKALAEVDVEYLFVSDLNIGLCKGCCACLTKGDDYCPNKDDIKIIEEKLLSADGVIILSPVYAMNMPAGLKNIIDRIAYTMHRPRFFNQYTMIGTITGGSGIKETIASISQLKYSGFNIVQSFGVMAPNPLINPELDHKTIAKIEKEAEKFCKKLLKKSPIKPTFETLIQFKIQRRIFQKHKDKLSCDWNYFNSKGWFNPKEKYYVKNAKIGFWDNLWATLIEHLYLLKI